MRIDDNRIPDLRKIPRKVFFHLGWLHGFQEAYVAYRHLKDAQSILIVGETSGRDSYYLRSYGKWTVAMDIVAHHHIPDLVLGDANYSWPFVSQSFDAIVMSEVLEHLYNDILAVKEARRVLKDVGTLFVTVPFYDDSIFHARLHSPRTIQTMLQVAGFRIHYFYERGRLLKLANVIEKVMALHYRIRRLSDKTLDQLESYHPLLVRIADWNLKQPPTYRGLLRAYPGGYIACKKGPFLDFNEIQGEWFKVGGKAR